MRFPTPLSNSHYSGTVLLAARRASFVVLVSDSLAKQENADGEVKFLELPKIITHRTLPLAVAAGGIARVPDPNEWVLTLIERSLEEITDASALDLDQLMRRFGHLLLEPVRRFRASLAQPFDEAQERICLFVGLVHSGIARLGQVMIGDTIAISRKAPFQFAPPLVEFAFTAIGHSQLWAPTIQDPSELAAHLTRMIEVGIRFEESRIPIDQQDIYRAVGGRIQVAIVETSGTRMGALPAHD